MTVARLALVQTVVTGLASGLGLFGIEAPRKCVSSLVRRADGPPARGANRPSATPVPETG